MEKENRQRSFFFVSIPREGPHSLALSWEICVRLDILTSADREERSENTMYHDADDRPDTKHASMLLTVQSEVSSEERDNHKSRIGRSRTPTTTTNWKYSGCVQQASTSLVMEPAPLQEGLHL